MSPIPRPEDLPTSANPSTTQNMDERVLNRNILLFEADHGVAWAVASPNEEAYDAAIPFLEPPPPMLAAPAADVPSEEGIEPWIEDWVYGPRGRRGAAVQLSEEERDALLARGICPDDGLPADIFRVLEGEEMDEDEGEYGRVGDGGVSAEAWALFGLAVDNSGAGHSDDNVVVLPDETVNWDLGGEGSDIDFDWAELERIVGEPLSALTSPVLDGFGGFRDERGDWWGEGSGPYPEVDGEEGDITINPGDEREAGPSADGQTRSEEADHLLEH